MQPKIKWALILLLVPAIVFYACKKYKDPPTTGVDPGVKDRGYYCNDPRAINYNWNFPAVPDSSICIYAVDSFKGSWTFYDTITQPSGDTVGTSIKQLTFTSTEDTALTHLSVTGWCSGVTPFYMTANNYGRADVDTFPGGAFGQFLCGQTDTLNGYAIKNSDSFVSNRMRITFTINGQGGITYHNGTAIKQ